MNSFLDEADDSWNHFVSVLATDASVPEKVRPHLARWVTRWRHGGGDESAAATTAFFEELGRSPTLQDWQFRQAVQAVERWCQIPGAPPWSAAFDWRGLADQAVALEATHRTLLRETIPACSVGAIDADPEATRNRDRLPVPGEVETIDALIERLRRAIRSANLAVATEQTYVSWGRRFSRFRLRRLREAALEPFDPSSAAQYLSYLALERRISPATQRQALNAVVFLARHVHNLKDEEVLIHLTAARGGSRRPPVVLTREEVRRVLAHLDDPWKLTCTNTRCSAKSKLRFARPRSPKKQLPTVFVTRSRRTCSKAGSISARYNPCWDTLTSRPP